MNATTPVSSSRVSALSVHRPEKKKRKKLMKDSLNLAAMLRRFTREKADMRKKTPGSAVTPRGNPNAKVPHANSAVLNTSQKAAGNDMNIVDLTTDPAMISLLGSANNNDVLQDMMGDLDFGLLDSPQPSSPAQGENGALGMGHKPVGGRGQAGTQMGILCPPPLPNGLPAPLTKRIEDLRTVSVCFLVDRLSVTFSSLENVFVILMQMSSFFFFSVCLLQTKKGIAPLVNLFFSFTQAEAPSCWSEKAL